MKFTKILIKKLRQYLTASLMIFIFFSPLTSYACCGMSGSTCCSSTTTVGSETITSHYTCWSGQSGCTTEKPTITSDS